MRQFIVAVALIATVLKFGVDYLFSEKFQDYGDKVKAPWTCQVNLALGGYLNMLSRYEEAEYYFRKVVERCPESDMAERGSFEAARCLENRGMRQDAAVAYEDFAAKYAGTRRARLAQKAASLLRN